MRYHGKIGFLTESQETAPGVWNEGTIIEKDCKGDVLKSLRQYEGTSDSTNDNLIIKNRLEIVADPLVQPLEEHLDLQHQNQNLQFFAAVDLFLFDQHPHTTGEVY